MNTVVDYPAYLTSSKNKKKYYSYWDCEQRSMVITDNYVEYITHEMRKRMGGDRGIHFPEHDPPFQIDLNF